MSVELTPLLKQRFFDNNGVPLAGGKVYTYAAGTTTPLATYSDSTGNTPNTNPVVLDSYGYADIWIGNNPYKFVVKDSSDVTLFTEDNINSIATQIAAISTTIQSVTMSYTQFQTASTSNAAQAFSLPAKSLITFIGIKSVIAFAGTSITAITAQVGPSGAYDSMLNGYDLAASVSSSNFDNNNPGYIGDFTSPTAIYLNMTSSGANLSALTQGSVTVYYDYKALP